RHLLERRLTPLGHHNLLGAPLDDGAIGIICVEICVEGTIPAALNRPDEEARSIEIRGDRWEVVRVLKSDAFAVTRLVRRGESLAVHKRSRSPRIGGVVPLGPIARWISRREARIYRLLDGVAGVPRFLGTDGADAYLHEWIPGTTLDRHSGRVNDEFFP